MIDTIAVSYLTFCVITGKSKARPCEHSIAGDTGALSTWDPRRTAVPAVGRQQSANGATAQRKSPDLAGLLTQY
jgi:hypothetical protein